MMKTRQKKVSLRLLQVAAATRALLGAGGALLFLSDMKRSRRRKLGWALFLTGAFSTVPLVYHALRQQ